MERNEITTRELAGGLSSEGILDRFVCSAGIEGLPARVLSPYIARYPVGLAEGSTGEERTPQMVARMFEYALYRLPPPEALLKRGSNERHVIFASDPDYMLPDKDDTRRMGFAMKRKRRYEDAGHSLIVENRGIVDLYENIMMFGTLAYVQEYYRANPKAKSAIRKIFYKYCFDCGITDKNEQKQLFYSFLRSEFIMHGLLPEDQRWIGQLPEWLKKDRSVAYAKKVFEIIQPLLEGKNVNALYFLNDFAMRNFLSMGLLDEPMPDGKLTLRECLLSRRGERAFQDIDQALKDFVQRYPHLDEKQKALFIDHALISFISRYTLNGNGKNIPEIQPFADRLKQNPFILTLIEAGKSPVSDSIYMVDFSGLPDEVIESYCERYGEEQVGFLREYKSQRIAFILLPYALGDVSYGLAKVFSDHYPGAVVMETGKVGNFAQARDNLPRALPVIPTESHHPFDKIFNPTAVANCATRRVCNITLPEIGMTTTLGLLLQAIPDMKTLIEHGMSDPLCLDMELAWMISALGRETSTIRADYVSDGTRASNMEGMSIVQPLGPEGWHGMLIAMLSVLQGYHETARVDI